MAEHVVEAVGLLEVIELLSKNRVRLSTTCRNQKGETVIEGDATVWEREPMERLAADSQLCVHFHHGFWQPMDTLRDRRHLAEDEPGPG